MDVSGAGYRTASSLDRSCPEDKENSPRGASWRDLRDPIDIDVHSIVIDPFDTQRVYAATGGGERSPYPKGKPLYRSNDGGQS